MDIIRCQRTPCLHSLLAGTFNRFAERDKGVRTGAQAQYFVDKVDN